jgi:hypothetical protein
MAVNPPLPRTFTRQARPRKRGNSQAARITIAALLPLSQLIEIRLIGTLFLQDVIAVGLLAILLVAEPNKGQLLKPLKPFILLALVWLTGAIITDIWVSSELENLARGWSKISLFIIHTLVLWLLSRGNLKVLAVYMLATGVVYVSEAVLLPTKLQEIDPWKFGIGSGLMIMTAALSAFVVGKNALLKNLPLALSMVVALISLLLNARSLFGVALLSVLYSFGASYLANRRSIHRLVNRWSFLVVIILGLLMSQAMIAGYGQLASQGALGEDARSKYERQTGADMSLLQGGRPESLVSIQAIKDSPIIGHGSWARDRYYTNMFFNELKWRGLLTEAQWWNFSESQADLIPSHSHLLGSWVEAGILSVPIWIYALILSFEALFAVVKLRSLPSLLATATAFFVIWDVLFSPFGADGRILKAAQICILISVTYSLRTSNRQVAAPNVLNIPRFRNSLPHP